MNIIATMLDLNYGKKHRDGRFVVGSKWEWGLGDDGNLYCRDEVEGSLFTEWCAVELLQLYIDLETIHKVSRWSNSVVLKSKLKPLLDKEAGSSSNYDSISALG